VRKAKTSITQKLFFDEVKYKSRLRSGMKYKRIRDEAYVEKPHKLLKEEKKLKRAFSSEIEILK
jgi:hypothetical protein